VPKGGLEPILYDKERGRLQSNGDDVNLVRPTTPSLTDSLGSWERF